MTWTLRPPSEQTARIVWVAVLTCAVLLGPPTAFGDDLPDGSGEEAPPHAEFEAERVAPSALEAEVVRLQATVDRLEASREATDQELRSLRSLVEAMGPQRGPTPPDPARSPAPTAPGVTTAAGGDAASEPLEGSDAPESRSEETAASRTGSGGTEAPETQKPAKVGQDLERSARYQAEREILEQRGGVLLPAGQLVVQPTLAYTTLERDRIRLSGFALLPAILIGRIDSVEIERDIYQANIEARYGLHDRIELSASIPYLWRVEKEVFGTDEDIHQQTLRGDGIGDLEVSLFTHIFEETGWIPDIILNLRSRMPTGIDPFEVDEGEVATGSGFWALSGGVTLTKVVDPVVLFASGNYAWNIDRDISGLGLVDPGDTVEYNLGLAFGLNERLALSFSAQHRIIGRTQLNGTKLDRTDLNAAAIFLGTSYVINRWLSPSLSVGFGVTNDAPDYQVQVSFPIRFPYRLPSLPFSW